MPLVDIHVPRPTAPLPRQVQAFLQEADRRIERFLNEGRIPGFVPSDYPRAYGVLQALAEADVTPGNLFCEWGSGFGVVACLASMLDFDAHGIEYEQELVDNAERLAADFDVPAGFVCGSFIPRGGEACARPGAGFSWLVTDSGNAYDDLGLEPADFDVIFAYPWPDEEGATERLFERYAASGAVLVTYHGGEEFRVRRKRERRGRRG